MNRKFSATAIAALVCMTTASQALDLKAGGQSALKVTKMQMGIQSPATNACPAQAKQNIWVFTNKAGAVPIFIARDGGGVAGPFMVKTKPTGNGDFMGVYSKTLKIYQPIDARYRASAPKHKQLSNWVALKASCKIGLGGNGAFKK